MQGIAAHITNVFDQLDPYSEGNIALFFVWLVPDRTDTPPGYAQKALGLDAARGALILAAGPEGSGAAVTMHQDARLYAAKLDEHAEVTHDLRAGRGAWLQVARGLVALNGTEMREGDGAAVEDEPRLTISALTAAEILLFDLA